MEEYLTTAGADSPISAFIPTYLEHLRIDGKSTVTLERYQERLQRFIAEMGDCRPDEITAEKVSLYRRQLMDSSVGPVTIGGFLSCLRGFLKYLRDVRGLRVMDGEKIKRPRIPQRSVEYLTKEELDRLLGAIPTHTWNGLRDRALIEVLFSSGMRISEVLGLDRAALEWELRQAVIIGKGRKERMVYFSEEAIDWLTKYPSTRHDDYPAVFVTTGSPPNPCPIHSQARPLYRASTYRDRFQLERERPSAEAGEPRLTLLLDTPWEIPLLRPGFNVGLFWSAVGLPCHKRCHMLIL